MTFDDLTGNEKVFAELKRAAAAGQVSHAYIFEGDASIRKELVAKAFVKAILCREHRGEGCEECLICRKIEHGNYEDIFVLRKDGNSVKDGEISVLQERLRNKPFGERNIAVIEDADTMTVWAQNRLLKTLEEPPYGTVLILLSENTENLLKTIVSRCAVVRLSSVGMEAAVDTEVAELAARAAEGMLSGESFHMLKGLLAPVLADRSRAAAFLDALESFYGRTAAETVSGGRFSMEYLYRQIQLIEEARRDLSRNVSAAYAIKRLILCAGAEGFQIENKGEKR